jgi:hypothetical protein
MRSFTKRQIEYELIIQRLPLPTQIIDQFEYFNHPEFVLRMKQFKKESMAMNWASQLH